MNEIRMMFVISITLWDFCLEFTDIFLAFSLLPNQILNNNTIPPAQIFRSSDITQDAGRSRPKIYVWGRGQSMERILKMSQTAQRHHQLQAVFSYWKLFNVQIWSDICRYRPEALIKNVTTQCSTTYKCERSVSSTAFRGDGIHEERIGEKSLEVCEVDKMEIGGGWRKLGEENVVKHTCNCGFVAQPLVHEGQIDRRAVSYPC